MLGIIARHEWRLLVRSSATAVIVVIGTVMIVVALVAGSGRARADAQDRDRLRDWAEAQATALAAEAIAVGNGESDDEVWGARSAEFVANERGTYAIAPLPPLAALTVGHSDRHPSHYRITARLREARIGADQTEHPLALLMNHADLAFVIVYLVPLLILALGFDLTAGERRSGTLHMVLARPIRLRTIVLGKLVARTAVLAALWVVIVVGALATSEWSWPVVACLGLWSAAAGVYGALWIALVVLVDARGRSAANNALVLTSAWLATVALLPAIIGLMANLVHPMPSRVELATAVRAASHAAAAESSRLLGPFLEDHPSAGVGRDGMRQYAAIQETREVEIASRLAPVLSTFERQLADRRAFVARLQYLSPAMLVQSTLAEVAGTSVSRHQAFERQAVAFQQRWKEYFAPRVREARPLSDDDYASMPAFRFEEEAVAAIARRVALPLGALACAAALAMGLGLRQYRSLKAVM